MRFIIILLIGISFNLNASEKLDSLLKVIGACEVKDSLVLQAISNDIQAYIGNNVEQALQLSDALIDKSKELENHGLVAMISMNKADVLRFLGRGVEALQIVDQILADPEIENHLYFKDNVLALKGALLGDQTKHVQAVEYYHQSIDLAKKTGDVNLESYVYGELGLLFSDQGNHVKALENHKKSYEIKLAQDDEFDVNFRNRSLGTSLLNIGSAYYSLKDYDSTLYYWGQAAGYYQKADYLSGLAGLANNMGKLHMTNGNYHSAIKELDKALVYDTQVGSKKYICIDYYNLASCYFALKDYTKSENHVRQTIKIASEILDLMYREKGYRLLSDIKRVQKDFDKAYDYYVLSSAYKDTIGENYNKKAVAEIEEKYQNEKKEAENQMLKREQEKNREIIRVQKFAAIVLSVALFAVFVILFFLFKQLRINRKLNSGLEAANQELSMLNRTKDRFFSIISHDLKGPIGTIKSMVELLVHRTDMEEEKVKKFLGILNVELGNTFSLLDNLLTWSRSQFSKIKIEPQVLMLHEEVGNILQLVNENIDKKHINLINQVSDCTKVYADKNVVSALIRNLVSNSIKFTPEGGRIEITANEEENSTVICISDTGVGMSEDAVNSLFRIDNLTTTGGTNNEGGTGLGLIICKEFVELHGGEIWAESEKDVGTSFFFSLPNRN